MHSSDSERTLTITVEPENNTGCQTTNAENLKAAHSPDNGILNPLKISKSP